MNKKTISKISLYFSGILSRMSENTEYFKNIMFHLKSGTKEFHSVLTLEENGRMIFNHQAVQRKFMEEDLILFLNNEFLKYDSLIIEYNERGAKIVIDADDKSVRMRHADVSSTETEAQTATVNAKREYIVNPALAKDLLTEIGILAKNGKIKNDKIRKYNQIDYFVELLAGVIKEIGDPEELVILDAACGKSYLSFVVNFYLREILKKKCRFIGIDYSDVVIQGSQKIARALGYHNMTFIKEDLTAYRPKEKIDIVISLHACDTATDMAIGLGIKSRVKAIISVPCCHKDILKQYSYEPFSAVTKHGILKARLADTLTDALRASYLESQGYKISMIEYISPLETPKNIMIRAIYTGKKNPKAMKEYENLKHIIHVDPAIERFSQG